MLNIASIGIRGIPSSYSGIERACEALYSGLAERGHRITVYDRCYDRRDHQLYRGIYRRSSWALKVSAMETLSHAATSLGHALVRGRYDVIHLHALAPCVFARVCKWSGTPTVATVHGLDWQRARWKGAGAKVIRFGERTMVKNIDEVIVVSQDLRGYFEREYGRRTVYIPNGVEPPPSLTAPEEDSLIREFGLSKRDYAICLGRLVPEKRVHDVILAFRHIDFPGKLVIVGDDSSTDPYVSHLRRLAVADPRVVFTGLQRRPSVHALLKNAAFYVSASELEGLPMSLLECMQHGIPAVVTDIPPHRELLDAVTGFESWFPPGDVDALQARMVALLKSYSRYLEVAEQSAELTEREYAWPSIVDRTEAVLYAAAERRVTYHSAQLATERFLQTTGEKRGGER